MLSMLPYGVTAAAAVAIGRFSGNDRGEVPSRAVSAGEDDS
jgi:hypothetical protein